MDHELQAGKNFAWATLAQFVLRILGLAFFILMSYFLKEAGMGKYNFITSFVLFWFLFVGFGTGGYLGREWAKKKIEFKEIEHDFYVVLTLQLFVSFIIFIPFLIINYFLNKDIYFPLIIGFVSVFLALFISFSDIFFQSTSQFKYPALRQIIEKLTIVILGSLALYFWPRIETVLIVTLLAQIISLFYYRLFSSLKIKFNLIFDFARMKELIKKGLPFLFIVIFISIYARIDMIMLKYMVGYEAVGWYGAAYKFLEMSLLFSTALFMPAIFPVLSNLYNDPAQKKQYQNFFTKATRIFFSSGIMLTLFFIFYSPLLISMLFQASFGPSALALRILIITQLLSTFTIFFNNLLNIQNKEKIGLYIIIFSAILNITLNLILIPKFSLYGSAWATVIAEIFNLALLLYFAEWQVENKIIFKMFALVSLNAVILIILKSFDSLNNYYLGTTILLINFWALFRVKLLQKEDLDLFLNPLKAKFNYNKYNELNENI
jgi:O-antigen/teichoic acid export membrane protein